MICPICGKHAKKSYAYPRLFVCSCTGVLEDIEVIKKTITSDNYHDFGYVKFIPKHVDVLGTIESLSGDLFYFEVITDKNFSLGTLVKFNKSEIQCSQTKMKFPLAQNLEKINDN